jgi:hypothetical protein
MTAGADGTPGRTPSPESILKLGPEQVDGLLDELEADVPSRKGLARIELPGAEEAIVIGDTHGDWRSTVAAVQRFLEDPRRRIFVGLGDYVDRAPDDCGEGSVANALYLLALAARHPERIYLIRGNHELNRWIPVLPHDLPAEIDALWGPDQDRYTRLQALLDRGPLAASTESGAYLAHAGFPRSAEPNWPERLDHPTEDEYLDLTWSECTESRIHRGVPRFTTIDLARFQSVSGTTLFLRGHDPDLNGRWSCGDRCLTLHTSRIFEEYGGVVIGRLRLDRPASRDAVRVEHLDTEGREFEAP